MIEVDSKNGALFYTLDDLNTIPGLWNVGLWGDSEVLVVLIIVDVWQRRWCLSGSEDGVSLFVVWGSSGVVVGWDLCSW